MLFNRNKEMQRSDSSFMVFRAYPYIFFDKSNIHIGHREFSLRKTPVVQSLVLYVVSRVSGVVSTPYFIYFLYLDKLRPYFEVASTPFHQDIMRVGIEHVLVTEV